MILNSFPICLNLNIALVPKTGEILSQEQIDVCAAAERRRRWQATFDFYKCVDACRAEHPDD